MKSQKGGKTISINKTVIINVLSLGLIQGISFITAPIFLRLLGAEQYGVYALFTSRVSIISCFMGLGAGGGLGTSRYDFKDEYYEFRSSNLLFGTLISIPFFALCLLFIKPLSGFMGFTPTVTLLVFLTSFSIFIANYSSSVFAYEKSPIKQLISAVSISLLNVGITFFFIWIFCDDKRFLARIYGYSFSQILVGIILWIYIFLKKPCMLNSQFNRYSIKIGFPMIFHTLSNMVLIQSDRIMMQHMDVPSSEIGIYTAYYSLASLLTVILTALNTSWTPYYYDDLNQKNIDSLRTKTKRYLELFTTVTCGFLLLAREVALVYCGDGYSSGINVLPILAVASYLIFMYQFPVNFEMYHKKTTIVAVGTICAASLNVMLNLIGIHYWGMYGASVVTVISYIFLFIAHFVIANRLKIAKFHIRFKDFIPWACCVGVAFFMFYFLEHLWIVRWVIGGIIGVVEISRIRKRRSIF